MNSRVIWDAKTETAFQERLAEQSRSSYQVASGLGALLFPAFSLIDWFTQREHFQTLSEIRYTTTLFFLWIYLAARRKRYLFQQPYLSGLVILFVAALSIMLMVLVTGGYQSPYYAGVNLVTLAAALLFPWGAKRMSFLVSGIFLIYLVPVLIAARFQIEQSSVFVNNLSFLISTCFIGGCSAHLSDRLRRENFSQTLKTEEARSNIERSVEILSQELNAREEFKDATDDVVQLSQQLASQKAKLQEANAVVTHALNAREEFISIASHELKTPLTVIRLQNDSLRVFARKQPLTAEQTQQLLQQTERNDRQIQRLTRLVDDMLDLTRLISGKMKFEYEPFALDTLVAELSECFGPQLAAAKMRLNLNLEPDLIGYWDRVRIEQVVSNLFANAIKYAPEQPLEVIASRSGNEVLLEFRDHGPGIPPDQHQIIFERFERGEARPGVSGLGLGLYISKKIIEGHQGRMWVESAPDHGSRFKLLLPLMEL